MKNSCRKSYSEDYRVLEHSGISGLALSVYPARPFYEKEISFSNLFTSQSLFFTLRIFEEPADYRIALSGCLLNQISITVTAAVRIFRKITAPLRQFFRKAVRSRIVYLFHCVLRL